jgi:hypothetical protein
MVNQVILILKSISSEAKWKVPVMWLLVQPKTRNAGQTLSLAVVPL